MGSSPPPGPPQGVPSLLEKDHVNLRMSYLVMGNPRPPHSLGNVHLNTTIQELKEKIQSELPEHPALGEQRLIYQGRPLLRNDATLRDVLRLEVRLENAGLGRELTSPVAGTRPWAFASYHPHRHSESADCSSATAADEPNHKRSHPCAGCPSYAEPVTTTAPTAAN